MPPASSAIVHSTIDGRSRLSSAAPSAVKPNDCGVNSAIAVRRLAQSQVSQPALAGDADRRLLDHPVAQDRSRRRARRAPMTARQRVWRRRRHDTAVVLMPALCRNAQRPREPLAVERCRLADRACRRSSAGAEPRCRRRVGDGAGDQPQLDSAGRRSARAPARPDADRSSCAAMPAPESPSKRAQALDRVGAAEVEAEFGC